MKCSSFLYYPGMNRPKKRAPGRPKGTGQGYTEMLRVALRPQTAEKVRAWAKANGATSESDALRKIIEAAVG